MIKIVNTLPRRGLFFIITIISLLPSFVTNLFCAEVYDLCYKTHLLREGKILFVRHRNPLLDPVLRTYETHLFDPRTGKITYLQKYQEHLYILPVISRDRSTLCYHSLIEGSDFLVTGNLEEGKSIRLRFDTGGYFVSIGLDYDNDTVIAVIKRGENKQALYLISNRASTIKRILNGTNFIEAGFFDNGNVYFVEFKDNQKEFGFTNPKTRKRYDITEGFDYFQKTPNGDGVLYSQGNNLYLYRVYSNESILLSRKFDPDNQRPLISRDGSTCAVLEENNVYIANLPSGDILYYLSVDTEDASFYLTDFTFYLIKDNKIFSLAHKKPGQTLGELYTADQDINLLAVSQNDRYVIYQHANKKEVIVYDTKQKKHYSKESPFIIEEILYPDIADNFYIISRTKDPETGIPIRELYHYSLKLGQLSVISTAANTDIRLYKRKE